MNTTFPAGGLKINYDKTNKKVDVFMSNITKQMLVYITVVFVDDKTGAIKSGPLYSKFTIKLSKSILRPLIFSCGFHFLCSFDI